jgi:hypothetical protein
MKTSSIISLICSLTINGFNTFYQPAAAQQLPPSWHVAEALSPAEAANEDDKLVAVQVSGKYGYQDAEGRMAILPRFDNEPSFDAIESFSQVNNLLDTLENNQMNSHKTLKHPSDSIRSSR